MTENIESRSVPFTMTRTASGDGLTLAGYAAVFNSPAKIRERGSEFEEQIAPGAFARTLNARERVIMQFDHGSHPFFGSLPLGKFTDMRETDDGLYVEARLHDNWFTHPVRDAIASGAIDGMSFRFSVPDGGDEWDRTGDMPKRTIREVKLVEAGPVVWPAYQDTVVGVRSALDLLTSEQVMELLSQLRSTPDEGSTSDDPATPDEGSRIRTKTQRKALAALHNI